MEVHRVKKYRPPQGWLRRSKAKAAWKRAISKVIEANKKKKVSYYRRRVQGYYNPPGKNWRGGIGYRMARKRYSKSAWSQRKRYKK